MQRSKPDYYHLTKTMNVTKPYSAFVGPGYSFSVLSDFKFMLKRDRFDAIPHFSVAPNVALYRSFLSKKYNFYRPEFVLLKIYFSCSHNE